MHLKFFLGGTGQNSPCTNQTYLLGILPVIRIRLIIWIRIWLRGWQRNWSGLTFFRILISRIAILGIRIRFWTCIGIVIRLLTYIRILISSSAIIGIRNMSFIWIYIRPLTLVGIRIRFWPWKILLSGFDLDRDLDPAVGLHNYPYPVLDNKKYPDPGLTF